MVRNGDILYTIARQFGVSVDALLANNQIADPSRLNVGQELHIPVAANPGGWLDYTVQPGDLLSTVAQRFGVTPEAILAINTLPNPNSLAVGLTIRIPLPR